MMLTKNFSLEELTATNYPALQTLPLVEQIINLTYLCAVILQPLRDAFGSPITISSGFRSEKLNKHVGGVANSYHLKGLAADIRIKNTAHARQLFDILQKNKFVDSCLFEHKGQSQWLHVQTRRLAAPRQIFNFNFKA